VTNNIHTMFKLAGNILHSKCHVLRIYTTTRSEVKVTWSTWTNGLSVFNIWAYKLVP